MKWVIIIAVGIYIIRNKVNRHKYIGESLDIHRRWQVHKRELRKGCHHCMRLQKEWNEYGEKAFKFSIVERFWFTHFANPDKLKIALLLREGFWMDVYDSILDYNTEYSIGDLKKIADLGKGNPKFKKYRKYRKYIRKNIKFAKHWFPHITVATLYNPLVAIMLWGVIVLVLCYCGCLLTMR